MKNLTKKAALALCVIVAVMNTGCDALDIVFASFDLAAAIVDVAT